MNGSVPSNNNKAISEKFLWIYQCLALIFFYVFMYITKEFFGIASSYKFFLFVPILFLILVKHALQPKGIMVSGSNSLKFAISTCGASGVSAVIFFLVNVLNK